ncbi:MAG: AmmeMemoRadiSam system radical SAM enzyme [Deltaproteobacteria bacterium]|jgi:pyruvate formate lyase activating enzyme|nr:AmmeMemoRadiSam system radical SAM enzyme [Deltaproteobacteria bacterium]MBW2532854.1 AmmeMemoRadiSam system radical SAM enzyme [Deltaproteobacteria bacterium]
MVFRKPEPPEARFFEVVEDEDAVQCALCGHRCVIKKGKRGVCEVREYAAGTLRALAYGQLLALTVDPIEKKPLGHFQPGTKSLSIASAGCNLSCPWCQNYHLSEMVRRTGSVAGEYVTPEEVVEQAVGRDCASISYTYSEPTIHYEYNRDTGVLAREAGLKNVFVTNGLMSVEAAKDAAKAFLDGANVDLKAMQESTYKKLSKGPLAAVLDSIRTLHEGGVWLEVTTLVIPDLNDGDDELRDAARFIASVSPDIPWHLSRYHPANRHDAPPTPVTTLRRAREIGLEEGLHYVYTGNVWGDEGEHTNCPGCGQRVIERVGYRALPVAIRGGSCTHCSTTIAGVEMP